MVRQVSRAAPLCTTAAVDDQQKRPRLTGQQKCHIHPMEKVTLTQKEQVRLQALNSLLMEHIAWARQLNLWESARSTPGASWQPTRREARLPSPMATGRRPANATPDSVVADVVHMASTTYPGANHTHLSELLSEREGIDIGRTTLRRILVNAGLSSPRQRRPPKHRVRRQRMPREGMLIQLDGSYHRWLGDDGPQFTILFAVDDATST